MRQAERRSMKGTECGAPDPGSGPQTVPPPTQDGGPRTQQASPGTGEARGGKFEPNILVFACNWCSYAGADLAGVSRLQMPPNCLVVRVMCSGRVNPELVLAAFSKGIDGVMILGCHPGECHYSEGNYHARRRALLLREILAYVGIEPARFRLKWVSASEGGKFTDVVEDMVREVKDLGPITCLQDCYDKILRHRETAHSTDEPGV